MVENRYMTVLEFAKYMGIGRNTAYKLVKNDPLLPIIHIGQKILVDKSLLDTVWIPNRSETTLR